jgi:excisionase family DNA binding protein
MTGDTEYLRAADIVRLTGVSTRTVRRWIADEIIPSVKLGGARLVARADLERLLCSSPAEGADGGEEEYDEESRQCDSLPECHCLTPLVTRTRKQ